MPKPFLLLLLLALPVFFAPRGFAAAPPAPGEIAPNETSLSVSGSGSVMRKPDYVDVVVAVEVHEKTATDAQNAAATKMDAVVKAIRAMSLGGLDLKSGSVNLSPQYEQRPNYGEDRSKIVGYVGSIQLRIRTTDLAATPKVIDEALKTGANRVDGVEFGLKQLLEAREEAMRLASAAAKRKAAVLADSLGLKLKRVASVNADSPQYHGRITTLSASANVMAGGAASTEDSIVPGEIEITVDVNLVYAADGLTP